MPQVIVIDEIGTELEAAGRADDRRARRPADRHGPRQQPRQPDAQPDPVRPDRRDPERDPRRRGGAPAADPEERPRAQGAADVRRHRRDRQDRERVTVHADVADTVDAMLRGDPVAPELRWRDEEGVHRSQGRPRPSPREQLGAERFAGLVGAGSPWRMEPGWRGDASYRDGGYREAERGRASGPATGRARAAAGAVPRRLRPRTGDPRARSVRRAAASGDDARVSDFASPPLSRPRRRRPGRRRAVRRRRHRRPRAARARRAADRGRDAGPARRASSSARRRGATRPAVP